MNIPNILTIFRLVLTVFFIFAVDAGELRIGLYLFILQGITDVLDGFLARTMGKKTNLGAFLDPVADKTMLVSAYIVLYLNDVIPLWITAIVLVRDLVICSGYVVLHGFSYKLKILPSVWSKINTGLQIITIVYVLWAPQREFGPFFFYVTALFTVISGLHYVGRGFRVFREKQEV